MVSVLKRVDLDTTVKVSNTVTDFLLLFRCPPKTFSDVIRVTIVHFLLLFVFQKRNNLKKKCEL